MFFELGHHLARPQALAVGPQALDEAGGHVEERQIVRDDGTDAGAQHFHRRLAPVRQHREMHLRHRCRSDRNGVERAEHRIHRLAIGAFQRGEDFVGGKRRHVVLQAREFVGDVERDEVAAGREHLAELDENRPQAFQRLAQTHAARRFEVAPEQGGVQPQAQPAHFFVAGEKLVQPEAQGDGDDFQKAEEAHSRSLSDL